MTEAEMWFKKYVEALNGKGIVMCKDCKWFQEHVPSPMSHCGRGTQIPNSKGEGFCSKGERKVVENDD